MAITRYVRAEEPVPQPGGGVKKTLLERIMANKQAKIAIAAGGGVLFLLLVIIVFALSRTTPNTAQTAPTATPGVTSAPTVVTEPTLTPEPTLSPTPTISQTITVSGVTVKNFHASAQSIEQDGTVVLYADAQYSILYEPWVTAFKIHIVSDNFLLARSDAEQQFLTLLGVTQPNACKLQVTEEVPPESNSRFAGLTFPLSFCKN